MTHVETLKAAERVRKIVLGEEEADEMVEILKTFVAPTIDYRPLVDRPGVYYSSCVCPIGSICMNAFCPRRPQITC